MVQMAYQYFGQWLLAKNLISSYALRQATEYQQEHNKPLGNIAIELGLLTGAQVEKINQEQKRTDRQFGQIAQDCYLLKPSEVEGLLAEQKKRHVMLGDALVKLGFMEQPVLDKEIAAHLDYQKKHQQDLSETLDAIPHGNVVQTFIDISIKAFGRIIHENFLVDSIATGNSGSEQSFYCFQQEIMGDNPFNLVFAMPEEVILKIQSSLYKEKSKSIGEDSLSAVKEFINIIAGNACVKAREKQLQLKSTPPQLVVRKPQSSPNPGNIIAHLISPRDRMQLQMNFL